MMNLIDVVMRVSRIGPLKYLIQWPLLAALMIKHKVDAHYYELLSDVQKREEIVKWGQSSGCKIMVETGTFIGATTDYASKHFEKCITIELDPVLYQKAVQRFKDRKNVQVYHGDSGQMLRSLIKQIDQPAIFWLDAHYCGDNTAKGGSNSPIIDEILTILSDPTKGHIILIDDARMFLGFDGYPSIRQLAKLVQRIGSGHELRVSDDIIKIFNPRCHNSPN